MLHPTGDEFELGRLVVAASRSQSLSAEFRRSEEQTKIDLWSSPDLQRKRRSLYNICCGSFSLEEPCPRCLRFHLARDVPTQKDDVMNEYHIPYGRGIFYVNYSFRNKQLFLYRFRASGATPTKLERFTAGNDFMAHLSGGKDWKALPEYVYVYRPKKDRGSSPRFSEMYHAVTTTNLDVLATGNMLWYRPFEAINPSGDVVGLPQNDFQTPRPVTLVEDRLKNSPFFVVHQQSRWCKQWSPEETIDNLQGPYYCR